MIGRWLTCPPPNRSRRMAGLSTLSIVSLAVVGFIVLAMIIGAVALVVMRSRRVGPAQPPFDELPGI